MKKSCKKLWNSSTVVLFDRSSMEIVSTVHQVWPGKNDTLIVWACVESGVGKCPHLHGLFSVLFICMLNPLLCMWLVLTLGCVSSLQFSQVCFCCFWGHLVKWHRTPLLSALWYRSVQNTFVIWPVVPICIRLSTVLPALSVNSRCSTSSRATTKEGNILQPSWVTLECKSFHPVLNVFWMFPLLYVCCAVGSPSIAN